MLVFLTSFAIAKDGSNTELEIEKRLTRIEVKLDEGFKTIQVQINGLQKQIDDGKIETKDIKSDIKDLKSDLKDVQTLLFSAFGLLFTSFLALFGFIMWDRRSVMKPIEEKTIVLEQKIAIYERIFRELAAGKPMSAELLRVNGL